MQLLGLESLKVVAQTSSLEIEAGVDVVVLRKNFFFSKPQLEQTSVFTLKTFNQLREAHYIIGGDVLYLKSTNCRC